MLSRNSYIYVKNNPLKYVDPTGEMEEAWYSKAFATVASVTKKAVDISGEFIYGTVYSISDNYTYGLATQNKQAPSGLVGQIGMAVGDALTYAASAFEMAFGSIFGAGGTIGTVGGLATCPVTAGAGCAVAAPSAAVAAAGTAMVGHGGSVAGYTMSKGSGGSPKPSSNFKTPTNPPQLPPKTVPEGMKVRVMKPTQQYPNGYWRIEKPMPQGGMQGIDPSTMKPGSQSQTHIPLPNGYW